MAIGHTKNHPYERSNIAFGALCFVLQVSVFPVVYTCSYQLSMVLLKKWKKGWFIYEGHCQERANSWM